ncbi:MAG TPA: DUF3999 family protein [Flavobacterium sp.]|uniref:DUF3999 family protein n=2 Tax=Flavobacterium TaxID=237 RepID=UPI0025C2C070|nr:MULTISPECIES: DUF3999 family protein [unclassified Flavobacterium]HRE77380.1 DUF3999 family protein [Flavobacterium sp.]
MKNKFAFLLILIAFQGFAQNYTGTLSTINQDGLHLILLNPDVRSATNSNTNFFRILDENKNEVAFVNYKPKNENKLDFIELPIISKQILNDSLTSIQVENKSERSLNSLVVVIANTSVIKNYNVSGSNDGENWFGLVQNQQLSNLNSEKEKQVEKTISFPLNNYSFLRIDFSDKKSLPINVMKVGLYQSEINYVNQLELTDFTQKIISNKEKKKTQITIRFQSPQVISKINFDIRSDLYFRNARILVNKSRKVKKRTENYQEEISSFVLNSKTNNQFVLDDFFEKEFIIEVDNQDNQPLEINKISFFQSPEYVLANLKTTENYTVIIDSTLSKPNYDLQNFEFDNSKELNVLTIENLKKSTKEKAQSQEQKFWQTKWFLWTCIAIGGLAVIYFALGMLKDMKEK